MTTNVLDKLKETICERCEYNKEKDKCMVLNHFVSSGLVCCLIHEAQEKAIEDVRKEIRKLDYKGKSKLLERLAGEDKK